MPGAKKNFPSVTDKVVMTKSLLKCAASPDKSSSPKSLLLNYDIELICQAPPPTPAAGLKESVQAVKVQVHICVWQASLVQQISRMNQNKIRIRVC